MSKFQIIDIGYSSIEPRYYVSVLEYINFGSYLCNDGIIRNWFTMIKELPISEVSLLTGYATREDAQLAIDTFGKDEGYNSVSPKFVKKMFTYEYPRAGLTVDCIIRHKDKVLLIERKFEPFANHLAIPGGFIDIKYETIEEACKREVKEETNLNVFPRFFCYADKVDRDTRGRTISFIFETILNDIEVSFIKAGDDAKDFVWIDFDYKTIQNTDLAFDHKEILLKFLASC